jgi:hypothetical protein
MGMICMSMGDNGQIYRLPWIEIKLARNAINTF